MNCLRLAPDHKTSSVPVHHHEKTEIRPSSPWPDIINIISWAFFIFFLYLLFGFPFGDIITHTCPEMLSFARVYALRGIWNKNCGRWILKSNQIKSIEEKWKWEMHSLFVHKPLFSAKIHDFFFSFVLTPLSTSYSFLKLDAMDARASVRRLPRSLRSSDTILKAITVTYWIFAPSPLFISHIDRPTTDPSILYIDYCFVWVCVSVCVCVFFFLFFCRGGRSYWGTVEIQVLGKN